MSKVSKYKKFLAPMELRERFHITKEEYESMLMAGLPVYTCAGVQRHSIDEFYQWCEDNNIKTLDLDDYCNATDLKKFLNIKSSELTLWEKHGLPKSLLYDKSGRKRFYYNKMEVIDWLKSHHSIVEV